MPVKEYKGTISYEGSIRGQGKLVPGAVSSWQGSSC